MIIKLHCREASAWMSLDRCNGKIGLKKQFVYVHVKRDGVCALVNDSIHK